MYQLTLCSLWDVSEFNSLSLRQSNLLLKSPRRKKKEGKKEKKSTTDLVYVLEWDKSMRFSDNIYE